MSRTAAQVAGDALPRSTSAVSGRGGRFDRFVVIASCTLLPVGLAWMVVTVVPTGVWFLLGGLPVYLLARYAFFRVRGSETGTFAVDRAGTVRILGGHTGILRLRRMFDGRVREQLLPGIAVGLLIGIGLPVGITALCVLLDDPRPALLVPTSAAYFLLDLLRWYVAVTRVRRRDDLELLDPTMLLPLMALYARHHGARALLHGVAADALAATVRAHPQDAETALRFGVATAVLGQLAR
ncbi:hypothetical protein WIS52_16025 [Pseudonocardia nematodicida]|uniref:Uncharacterized protein n=1 Tax=Pseudonocardia nematodicida TaxID=1206997 RepID=A0ABV1KBX5_9PSEU